MKRIVNIVSVIVTCAVLTGCGHGHKSHDMKAQSHRDNGAAGDIVQTAKAAGSFSTLLTAAEAADLVGVLKSDGPFTVFAPTDEAFAKLPPGTVDHLLAHPEKLREVLKYHVVAGRVEAADVARLSSATTLQGQSVSIDTTLQGVRIDGANVVQADVLCRNGVIHVIDRVILPNS